MTSTIAAPTGHPPTLVAATLAVPPAAVPPAAVPTTEELLDDLEAGRSRPLHAPTRLLVAPGVDRPTLGGGAFRRAYAVARGAGSVRPAWASRALSTLWFTPWIHPASRRAVEGFPVGARPWTAAAGGRRLSGWEAGQGPTVVLVHGWAGRAADLRHVGGDLVRAGFRVVAPDLPAHGHSEGRRTDLIELADALAGVIRREGTVRALVTHSLGFPVSVLALGTTTRGPAALAALSPPRALETGVQGFAARARLGPALTGELRRVIESRFGADVWDRLRVDHDVADLGVAGLVVHDEDDAEVPVADGRAVAAAWPGATFAATRGLGHRRILTDPTVRRTVVDHLASHAA